MAVCNKAAAAMARQAASLARLSSSTKYVNTPQLQASSLVHRRSLATASEEHGTRKVNFWEAPMHPRKWKEEQFFIISLVGWGGLFYGGYKYFTKEDKKNVKVEDKSI